VDVSLEEGQVRRAYDFYSPVYDFLFKKIFEPGRIAGMRMIGPEIGGRVLKVMDASALDFGDGEFDATLATYTISAVPDPVAVLREMRRVTKPGGTIVILNHFRSRNPLMRRIEDALAPVCAHLGWKTNLVLDPLLKTVGLTPEVVRRVNLLRGWCLVKCINPAP